MKRQRYTIGAIVEMYIDNNYYVYGQLLPQLSIAVFDYKTADHLTDITKLQMVPVLFIVAIYPDIISKGIWPKIGKLDIRKDLQTLPMEFIYDVIADRFKLYNPNTGEITRATKNQCIHLERAAVWAQNHVEDRIRDHYAGVPNIWVEMERKVFNK